MVETIEIFGMLLRVVQDNGELHDCYGCAFFDGKGCKVTINNGSCPCYDSDGNQNRHFEKLTTESNGELTNDVRNIKKK